MKSFIECSICSDRFGLTDDSDELVTPCGHVYHGHCLAKWLKSCVGTTCPECRCSIAMFNCRRIYFRYSNDTDAAETHIEYLNKELLKKTIDLQDERNNKRRLECEFSRQIKDKEYQVSKLKQKLKEQKLRRQQLEAELACSSTLIQNNAIYHNLFNMNQSGLLSPQIQSSNAGTIQDTRFLPYPNGATGPIPGNGLYNTNQVTNTNNQSARSSHSNNSHNVLTSANANVLGHVSLANICPYMTANTTTTAANGSSIPTTTSRASQSANISRSMNAFSAGTYRSDPNISSAYNSNQFTSHRQQANRSTNNEPSEIIINQMLNSNATNHMTMNNSSSNINGQANSAEAINYSSNGYVNRVSSRANTSSASPAALAVNHVNNLENQNVQQASASAPTSASSSVLPSVDQFLHHMYGAMSYNNQSDNNNSYLGMYYNLISDNI